MISLSLSFWGFRFRWFLLSGGRGWRCIVFVIVVGCGILGGGCGWFIGIIVGVVFISIYSFITSVFKPILSVTGVMHYYCSVDYDDIVDNYDIANNVVACFYY